MFVTIQDFNQLLSSAKHYFAKRYRHIEIIYDIMPHIL